MNYCRHCGSAVSGEENYCRECGGELNRGPTGQPRKRHAATSAPRRQSRDPRERQQQTGNNTSRRNVLLGGVGIVGIIGGAGWLYFLFRDDPTKSAEQFVEHIGNGEFAEANELIHTDARIQNAGAAVELLAASTGADALLDVAEISVADSNVINQDESRAEVSVTVDIDLQIEEGQEVIGLQMQKEEQTWYVWDIGI